MILYYYYIAGLIVMFAIGSYDLQANGVKLDRIRSMAPSEEILSVVYIFALMLWAIAWPWILLRGTYRYLTTGFFFKQEKP